MIRIKDYILNENELLGIVYIKEKNKLELISKDKYSEFIENATFEDIEWNYGVTFKILSEEEQLKQNSIKFYSKTLEELEEENKRLKKELELCKNNGKI